MTPAHMMMVLVLALIICSFRCQRKTGKSTFYAAMGGDARSASIMEPMLYGVGHPADDHHTLPYTPGKSFTGDHFEDDHHYQDRRKPTHAAWGPLHQVVDSGSGSHIHGGCSAVTYDQANTASERHALHDTRGPLQYVPCAEDHYSP